MDRLACVDVPALPLQLLLRDNPQWSACPVAVVAEDRPQAAILWVNDKARRARVRTGMRYAAALAVESGLRAGAVSPAAIRQGVSTIADLLRQFSPDVEPWDREPGLFWINAGGLSRLYDPAGRGTGKRAPADSRRALDAWSLSVRKALATAGFRCALVVGFTRFGTYAAARTGLQRKIFSSLQEEAETSRAVSLDRLAVDPAVRDELEKLGITTVGALLRLPEEGVGRRFGDKFQRLVRWMKGDLRIPLQPEQAIELASRRLELEHPEIQSDRLLFLVKEPLDGLLNLLASRGEGLGELVLDLRFRKRQERQERIRPFQPTLDAVEILGLLRLRLEAVALPSPVEEMTLTAHGAAVNRQQLLLFADRPRRDPAAAGRALARLRAEFGEEIVVRAQLRDEHLPRASFSWEALQRLQPAPPPSLGQRPLVRRIYDRPLLLPPRSRHEPDGWLLRGLEHGPVKAFEGPYFLSGGWWAAGFERDYYFARMQSGCILWVFYDRQRRRWFLEGLVE